METHEEGGSASPRGGRDTEAKSRPVPHRSRLVDGDRAPCTTDHQADRVSRQEPRDDGMDRASCTTRPPEDRGLWPLGESRAASGRRISFKTYKNGVDGRTWVVGREFESYVQCKIAFSKIKGVSSCQESEKRFWIPRNWNRVYWRVDP